MKNPHRILRAFFFLTLLSLPLQAEEGILQLRVLDLEGKAVKVRIGPASTGPYELTLVDGGARIVLPPQTRPGERVPLKVLGGEWVIFSPWDARVQVPPFEEKADNVVLVVVGRRRQKELLQSGDVLQALARRVLTAIEGLEQSRGETTEAMRRGVLAEQADAFGLTAEEVDRALRAWRDAPISLANKELAKKYVEHYPRQILREGSVSIEESTLHEPVIVTNPKDSPITIDKARTDFDLRGQINPLGLGMKVQLSVGASPPDAIDRVDCSWSLEPAGIMTHLSPMKGPCELEILLPVLPLRGRGKRIPVTFRVAVTQGGTVVEKLARETILSNEILADTLLVGEQVGQTSVTASVVDAPSQQVLAPHYECGWDFPDKPVVFTPLLDNGCKGKISLKPEAEWTDQERALYWVSIASSGGEAVGVAHLRARGTEETLGQVQVLLRLEDIREEGDPFTAHQLMSEAIRSKMTKALAGTPERAHFEPTVGFYRGNWQLTLASKELSSHITVQGRFDDGEWVPVRKHMKLNVPEGSRKVTFRVVSETAGSPGPFEFNLGKAALDSILRGARSGQRRILSCSDRDYCEIADGSLLPVIRSISWGIEHDALRSNLRLPQVIDDVMQHTASFSSQAFPKPLCGETLYFQLELVDGTRSQVRTVEISRQVTEEYTCPPTGTDFDDPRILKGNAAALPAFATYCDRGSRRGLMLRTFSTPGVEEVRYSYTPGGARIEADSYHRKAFILPEREGVKVVEMEFTLQGGFKVGPFTYKVNMEALKQMDESYSFNTTNFLRCFQTEKSTLCVPNAVGGGDGSEWTAISHIEVGTTPDKLDFSEDLRGSDKSVRQCLTSDCLFSFILPQGTQEVFSRVRFWHGGWSDVHRFSVP